MELYKHDNYEDYVKAQIEKNVRKIKLVWIKPKEVSAIVDHIKKNISEPKFGICHGVRNAWEVKKFREFLGVEVLGTEISHTAEQFENTIQWDFHDVKPEWVSAVDFIYSNSFDHSHSPEMCLDTWMSCLKNNGICYIHWNIENSRPGAIDSADCFNATEEDYRKLFSKKYIILDEFRPVPGRTVFAIRHKKEKR